MIGLTRSWPAWFEFLLFFRRENPWRLTGITHHRVRFGFVFRTVQEERLRGTFDGSKIFERRERIMRAGDLLPVSDALFLGEVKRRLKERAAEKLEPGELVRRAEAAE